MKEVFAYNESGRSMVEMLGVLAIVGVLSVGGIIGLRQALTNARANDLIYEANKRATVVSGQLIFSNAAPSLSEFVQNEFSFGTFNSVTPGSGTFTISINGVSEAVCAKTQNMASGIIVNFAPQACSGDDNTILLTYNNDLSEGNLHIAGVIREPHPEDGPTIDDGSDCSGQTRKGECQVCKNGLYIDSDAVCLSQGKSTCIDGMCTVLQIDCMSNGDCRTINPSQCGNGECYCDFDNFVNTCTGPTRRGICILKTQRKRTSIKIDNHNYIVGGSANLDWWSAKNFCAAYNARMMTLEELGCGEVGTQCTDSGALFTKLRAKFSSLSTFTSEVGDDCQMKYVRGSWSNNDVIRGTRDCTSCNVICY